MCERKVLYLVFNTNLKVELRKHKKKWNCKARNNVVMHSYCSYACSIMKRLGWDIQKDEEEKKPKRGKKDKPRWSNLLKSFSNTNYPDKYPDLRSFVQDPENECCAREVKRRYKKYMKQKPELGEVQLYEEIRREIIDELQQELDDVIKEKIFHPHDAQFLVDYLL